MIDGLTVLVVEDDWLVRENIAGEFRREGWTVLEAGTGASALRRLRETKILDVPIRDIRLADATTGWDIAEAARGLHSKNSGDLRESLAIREEGRFFPEFGRLSGKEIAK